MKTIEIKQPEQLYKACPLLEDIKQQLEDSQKNAEAANLANKEKADAIIKDNKKITDGAAPKTVPNYPTRYGDDYRITALLKDNGKWDEHPSIVKHGGAKEFETDISNLATTRHAKGFKIVIYNGRRSSNAQQGKEYTAYLSEEAKETDKMSLGNAPAVDNSKIEELQKTIDGLVKSNEGKEGYNPLVQQLQMDKQLSEIRHENAINNLKNENERTIEKMEREHKDQIREYQNVIDDLTEELEEAQEKILEQDGELGSVADKLHEKYEPPIQKLGSAILKNALQEFAMANPKVIAGLARISEAELKQLLLDGKKALDAGSVAPNKEEGANATIDFNTPKDEYEGFDPKHAELIKSLHACLKALTPEQFSVMYIICAYCFDPGTANFNAPRASKLYAIANEDNNPKSE